MNKATFLIIMSGSLLSFSAAAAQPQAGKSDTPTNTDSDGIRRSVVQRGFMPFDKHGPSVPRGVGPAVFPEEFRTIDGSGNNSAHFEWGAAGTEMMRMMNSGYPLADGGEPARNDGPSARAVSNALCASPGSIYNPINASDFLWQWGQFVDHDFTEAPVSDDTYDIPVPAGDPWFDPDNTGKQVIGLHRSAFIMNDAGERQQVNNITSFIDASNVYGSEHELAEWLRTHDGTGMLKTSEGGLLPYNTDGFHNAPSDDDPTMFLGGDIRANEQAGLTCMHTLFVREHNYWAQQIAAQFPAADGDEIYERARAIVAAEMQAITYNEFLPVLLGVEAMGAYQGYDPAQKPMIANEFATAAYRVGHTMLSPEIKRLEATDQVTADGHLPLQQAFFNPTIIENEGIEPMLRGLASNPAQMIDTYVVDDIRNFLFGPPGAGGFDLASLNIQRGRDHGVPDLNTIRVAMGLPAHATLADISNDPEIGAAFESVYSSVDEVDPWVGMLAEPHVEGSLVGETLQAVIVDQFQRLRHADRFWYETYLPEDMIELVNQQTLSVIIKRNTEIGDELADDVFQAAAPCPGDFNNDGVLNYFDISSFVQSYSQGDIRADFHEHDGVFNFFDINAFIDAYSAGCE